MFGDVNTYLASELCGPVTDELGGARLREDPMACFSNLRSGGSKQDQVP